MDEHGTFPLTPQGIFKTIQKLSPAPCSQWWVGYSGGLDSTVLLHLLSQALSLFPDPEQRQGQVVAKIQTPQKPRLGAIHIHHGIHPKADDWAAHCEAFCQQLKLPFHVVKITLPPLNGRSLEEVAREQRYQAFKNFLGSEEALLLAHHQSDQAETLLLRLLRGGGPQGLSAMRGRLALGKGFLLRPLLTHSKENIIHYANTQALTWIEDDSNTNTRFDRNFLRQEIMPRLTARWPKMNEAICRAAELYAETADVLDVFVAKDFEFVRGEQIHQLSVVKLLELSLQQRQAVIRHWLRRLQLPLPSREQLDRIEREVLGARPDRKPSLKIGDYEILRLKGRLICGPAILPLRTP